MINNLFNLKNLINSITGIPSFYGDQSKKREFSKNDCLEKGIEKVLESLKTEGEIPSSTQLYFIEGDNLYCVDYNTGGGLKIGIEKEGGVSFITDFKENYSPSKKVLTEYLNSIKKLSNETYGYNELFEKELSNIFHIKKNSLEKLSSNNTQLDFAYETNN